MSKFFLVTLIAIACAFGEETNQSVQFIDSDPNFVVTPLSAMTGIQLNFIRKYDGPRINFKVENKSNEEIMELFIKAIGYKAVKKDGKIWDIDVNIDKKM